MQPHVFERALHAWPKWGELIHETRVKMNYKPNFLENEAEKWEKDVGWEKVIELESKALGQLGLPWYFGLYWLACFCSDYERGTLIDYSRILIPPKNASDAWSDLVNKELIKDRGIVMLYHKGGPGKKLFPPYPFILETSLLFAIEKGKKPSDFMKFATIEVEKNDEKYKVAGLFKSDENGNIDAANRTVMSIVVPAGVYMQIFFGQNRKMPPEFRVEFPMYLATEDVVDMAFKQIQVYREGVRQYLSHPLLQYIGQAKVSMSEDILNKRHESKDDICRYEKGELTFEDLIIREWKRDFREEGTVAVKIKNKEVSMSKALTIIYYRVRRRLQRNGLTPLRPEKGWRSKLKL